MTLDIKNIKFTASNSSGEVSGIVMIPEKPKLFIVFAHGAGAPMKHPFMEKMARKLAEHEIATLRYNFPYTEKNSKRIDPAPILMETVRSAITKAFEFADNIPVFAGGKSMGGRMTSMAISKKSAERLKGIIFFGFPLHPPGKASTERADHLFSISIPMLFLQGTRDKLADLNLLKPIVDKLSDNATIKIFEGTDHSFQVLKKEKRTNDEIMDEMINTISNWSESIIKR